MSPRDLVVMGAQVASSSSFSPTPPQFFRCQDFRLVHSISSVPDRPLPVAVATNDQDSSAGYSLWGADITVVLEDSTTGSDRDTTGRRTLKVAPRPSPGLSALTVPP